MVTEEMEENREKEVEKEILSIGKRLPHSFPHTNYARVGGQGSSPWYFHDQNRSFQHRSYGLRTDHHPHSSTSRRHPSYHRTSAQPHHKRGIWHYRTERRTANRTHTHIHQEGVLKKGGSSGYIRRHKVAVGTLRVGTGSEDGRYWPRWMDPRVVCSSRR